MGVGSGVSVTGGTVGVSVGGTGVSVGIGVSVGGKVGVAVDVAVGSGATKGILQLTSEKAITRTTSVWKIFGIFILSPQLS